MYPTRLSKQFGTKIKNFSWQRFVPNKTARVVTIAITIISVLFVWAVITQARTCCGGLRIGSITYVGRATQVKNGQLYQYEVVLEDSVIDIAITNGGGQINIVKDVFLSDVIVRLDHVEVTNVDRNGSEEYEILVSPICDDVRVQAPEIFPNANWDCAERADEFGNVIFLPPPENTTPDEAILLKETLAKVTQQQCQDNNNDEICDLDINGDVIFIGASFTERLNCTLPAGFNFDGIVVIRGDDNIERIFCPNCPSPDAPVEMNCRKAK